MSTRNGGSGSDRLLVACYDELKATRARLLATQIQLDNALKRWESRGWRGRLKKWRDWFHDGTGPL
jgi:hypothetical protein